MRRQHVNAAAAGPAGGGGGAAHDEHGHHPPPTRVLTTTKKRGAAAGDRRKWWIALPLVLALLVAIYLVFSTQDGAEDSSGRPRARSSRNPLRSGNAGNGNAGNSNAGNGSKKTTHVVLEDDVAHAHCHPMQVITDPIREYTVLRCGSGVLGGTWTSVGLSLFVQNVMQAAAGLLPAVVNGAGASVSDSASASASEHGHALVFGLGAGHTAGMLHSFFNVTADVVEWNDKLVDWAVEHFGYEPTGHVYILDASRFLDALRYNATTDTISGAAFPDGVVPRYTLVSIDLLDFTLSSVTSSDIYTLESLQRLRALLAPAATNQQPPHVNETSSSVLHEPLPRTRRAGALTINYFGNRRGADSKGPHSLLLTLQQVFAHVRVFHDGSKTDPSYMVFFASDDPLEFQVDALPAVPTSDEIDDTDDPAVLAQSYKQGVWKRMLRQWELTSFEHGASANKTAKTKASRGDDKSQQQQTQPQRPSLDTPHVLTRTNNPLSVWQVAPIQQQRDQVVDLFPFLKMGKRS